MFSWLLSLFRRPPDFIIGGERPYLLRWFIIPRNNWFNIYLHKFVRDDDDRAMHDHPWWFISFLFWGRYDEIINAEGTQAIYRNAPSICFRHAGHRHRVVLPIIIDYDSESEQFINKRRPAWTLFFTGPKVREWGFWCPKGFVGWREFTGGKDGERVGRGCDQ